MNPKIKVMLVDDQEAVRAGYRGLLSGSENIEVVAEAERGEDACLAHPEVKPNVVVMELTLPGTGGLSAVRRVVNQYSPARVLILSVHDEIAYVSRALLAGARGYMTKNCPPELLIEAVAKVALGQKYLEPRIAHKLALHRLERAEAHSALDALSPREFDVFSLFARGYSIQEVAEELRLGHKTAANYATLLKGKLKLGGYEDMARLADRYGLQGG